MHDLTCGPLACFSRGASLSSPDGGILGQRSNRRPPWKDAPTWMRLIMDENDPLASGTPEEPFEPRIVEATPVPEYGGYVGDATPPIGVVTPDQLGTAPTEAIPVVAPGVAPTAVPPTTVSPAAYAPAAPMYRPVDPPPPGQNPAWPYFIAVIALLAGGLVGYLIAIAIDDDEAAPAATAPITSEVLVTDPNTEAVIADLQAQIADLTAAQEDSADQIAELETALADMTAERDALAAEIADAEGSGTDQQADLDAANEQIAVLEDQLATALTDLESANESVAEAEAALQTAVTERDAATDALEALNLIPNPNFGKWPGHEGSYRCDGQWLDTDRTADRIRDCCPRHRA